MGRRLTQYFDQLKADRRMLANQLKTMVQNQEVEMNAHALHLKETLKKAYQEELKINMHQF